MQSEKVREIKSFLSQIDINKIIKKIETLKKINVNRYNDSELLKEIGNTISIKIGETNHFIILPLLGYYKPKTRFYRVRTINKDDSQIPLKAMTYEQDAWNPPAGIIKKRGRLNKIGESLLYVSPIEPTVPIEEMKIKDGDLFCLIVYEANQNINFAKIGLWQSSGDFTREENFKIQLISDFLNDLFSKEIPEGKEFLYRIPELITKYYYNCPIELVDAWAYLSIAAKISVNKEFTNLCFRPEIAKLKLNLLDVQICQVIRMQGYYNFTTYKIASNFDSENKFIYHEPNSQFVKSIFPELQPC